MEPTGPLYYFHRCQRVRVTATNASGGLSFMLTKLSLKMTVITCECTDGYMVSWAGDNAR